MKRLITATVFSILAIFGSAVAQEPTLAVGSMEAYQESLLAMAEPLGPDEARRLVLQLGILAGGPVPDGEDPAAFRQAAMAKMMAHPQVFLDRLKEYEGLTSNELMAIDH